MQCPRCKSSRLQRGYKDAPLPLRLVGLHELLCNQCGLEFKGLDPLHRLERAPSFGTDVPDNRRRAPRYGAHLPAMILLAEQNPETGKLCYSQPSRGHCESISKLGLALSLVGARFAEEELSRAGRLLFVTMDLPNGPIDAVVSAVMHDRSISGKIKGKWLIGASIRQMSESDTVRLATYLDRRSEEEPLVITESY